MSKFTLASFQQGKLLRPDEAGVCVALCDIWLESFLNKPSVEPQHRMIFLEISIGRARSHQTTYGNLRGQQGPTAARGQMGQQVGIDYDEQTTVMAIHAGKGGMLKRVSEDIRPLGAAATWSMRFTGGGGHAIAGVNRLERITSNFARSTVHVFDPNIGEYVGAPDAISDILDDLFGRFPIYAQTAEIRRTNALRIS